MIKRSIYLTQASAEAKAELAKRYEMCICCDFEGTIWLSANESVRGITIHGTGYFDNSNLELQMKDPTPEKICRFYVCDAVAHGSTVILTPDVKEFVRLIQELI